MNIIKDSEVVSKLVIANIEKRLPINMILNILKFPIRSEYLPIIGAEIKVHAPPTK